MIDQCIWLCANTAGESLKLRNLILSETFIIDAMSRIIVEAQKTKSSVLKGMVANMMWCVSNLARSKKIDGNEETQVSITQEEMTKLLYIIRTFMDLKGMSLSMQDALWALAYLVEQADDNFITQVCQGKDTMKYLIEYLTSPLEEEMVPALRAIGNILSSTTPENIDLFLYEGGLSALDHLMVTDQSVQKMKEILWSCSNITAGTEDQIANFL